MGRTLNSCVSLEHEIGKKHKDKHGAVAEIDRLIRDSRTVSIEVDDDIVILIEKCFEGGRRRHVVELGHVADTVGILTSLRCLDKVLCDVLIRCVVLMMIEVDVSDTTWRKWPSQHGVAG